MEFTVWASHRSIGGKFIRPGTIISMSVVEPRYYLNHDQ
ncbi:uncharacterized protein METZ01_LOCUS128643 [marine metagenome]|uniref:Uncharacterized protein n=1 Tax=marine metagenome TaxID=408172 RepID=A0A381YFF1_9ZZZZ